MMQVEEKPDVTYSDVGGCKEQIEKLREVVETPLLSVCSLFRPAFRVAYAYVAGTFRQPRNRPSKGRSFVWSTWYRKDTVRAGCS